ncbi:MAG TPA: tetratricopeptide repeat protein [Gemmataceae bacterium]|nr:tetratricopeptide repeat protein [Gemmataceae bacterium]
MIRTRCAIALTAMLSLAHSAAADSPFKTWIDTRQPPDAKLPISGLPPAKLFPGLCVIKYRVTTSSPECQAFFDQGLGYYYSYVWMEACRSFETACRKDPDCAMAWWALSQSLERYHRPSTDALKKAQSLMPKASHREQLLIQAKLEEKGMWPNVGNTEARMKAAIKTIDTLLAIYDDDEEGWYFRAQLAGGSGLFGGQVSSAPFYKALLHLNPLHPGANHELLHFYENMKRPALGWQYSEKYIESTPGIPHSFHMQAHLAMRLGRWDKTTDRSMKAIEMERAYHKEMNVKPSQDQQFTHHCEILMRALTHDGRFAEARAHKKQCQADGLKHTQQWFRLHLAERDYDTALKIANDERKRDKNGGAYLAALVYLKKKDTAKAAAEVAILEEGKKNANKQAELKLWEVKGILLCQQGKSEEGLKLLAKAVNKTKDEYSHHQWGNGAYHMQAWGLAALGCHNYEVAEEAFLEALAHDPGCFHAALGLQVMCEKLGRKGEAERYQELAQRCWRKAAPDDMVRELELLREECAEPQAVLCADGGQDSAIQAGLERGSRPGPYASVVVTGTQRGTSHCFICETADKPAVIIFARSQTDGLGKLAAGVDKAIAKNKDADLRSWITFLHADQSSMDAKILQWARQHAITNIPTAVFEDVGGPPSYKLSKDADVTVLLSVNQKVVATFTFRSGELTEVRIAEVLKGVAELVKK